MRSISKRRTRPARQLHGNIQRHNRATAFDASCNTPPEKHTSVSPYPPRSDTPLCSLCRRGKDRAQPPWLRRVLYRMTIDHRPLTDDCPSSMVDLSSLSANSPYPAWNAFLRASLDTTD